MKRRAKAIYFLHGKCEENNKRQAKEKEEQGREKTRTQNEMPKANDWFSVER